MSDFDFFFETRVRAAYEKGFTGPFNMEAVEAVLECFVGHAEKWDDAVDTVLSGHMSDDTYEALADAGLI